MSRTAVVLLPLLVATACLDAPDPLAPAHAPSLAVAAGSKGGPTHFSSLFTATAMCGAPIGNIRFTGMIEGIDHTRTDGRGETHRTRQFRVKGLTGLNLATGETYVVIGGAEMLTWNTQVGQIPGNPGFSTHAGTLVFEPVDGGDRIVAHHAIRYIEDANGEVRVSFHEWSCR